MPHPDCVFFSCRAAVGPGRGDAWDGREDDV